MAIITRWPVTCIIDFRTEEKSLAKKTGSDFVDDGRVIADMSVDGMPPPLFGRKRPKTENGKDAKKAYASLSGREKRNILFGVISSYLFFGFFFFGALAMLLIFMIKVWFK